MKKSQSDSAKKEKRKISRTGIHAKTKTSNHKGSKHYKKQSRGQG